MHIIMNTNTGNKNNRNNKNVSKNNENINNNNENISNDTANPIFINIITFIKKETVLSIAIVLAVLSMFVIRPDREYISYIDFRTLAILFCLMTIVASFRQIGAFDMLARKMLQKMGSITGIVMVLVLMCFFTSMFITNDIALITFVPLAIIVLGKMENDIMITCVVMQTIAANLGSMLTPIGNPQNLFLYGKAEQAVNMGIGEFIMLMLPYSLVSLVLLITWIVFSGRKWSRHKNSPAKDNRPGTAINVIKSCYKEYMIVYGILFIISLLAVAHKIHYIIPFILVLIYSIVRNRKVLKKVDYSLLATFVALFIFIGNLGRITEFAEFLKNFMNGKEMYTAIAASQIMSNVPAAVLLEQFTDNTNALIIGTNLGGLGTLIASMASLISFKYIARENESAKAKYLGIFTFANVVFLVLLVAVYILI